MTERESTCTDCGRPGELISTHQDRETWECERCDRMWTRQTEEGQANENEVGRDLIGLIDDEIARYCPACDRRLEEAK